jgi:glutamate carboxypeptidase
MTLRIDPIEAAVAWLAGEEEAMERALQALVQVNSFTENVDGGRKVGTLLREKVFDLPEVTAEVKPSTRFADHLVFRTTGREGKPPVALIGHLDTVFPPGTFEGYRREGGLARGPGVLDMKGGLVVIGWAIKALRVASRLERIPSLVIPIVADEEVGSPEGQGIIREAIAGASAALVFEAGRKNDAIITRRKGTGALTVTATGKAAHAGNNHKDGANAIWALARFVERAQQLTDYDRGVTVNVGTFQGGTSKNTVPEKAELKLDFRFHTKTDGEALARALEKAAAAAGQSVQGTHLDVSGGIARLPMERSDASGDLLAAYGACAKMSGLDCPESPLLGGGSDASTSSQMGIPSIDGLGPRGSGFHTHDEQIEVATLVPKAQALARFLASK